VTTQEAPEETLVTDEMRSIVGQVMATATSFPISESDIRKWALAVYYPVVPPRLFWDEDYAATTRFGGIVAPEEFNPFAWAMKDPDPTKRVRSTKFGEFERVLGVEPPPYKAVLQSDVAARYSPVRMRPGDVIRSSRRITKYFERHGRMGLMLYTTISLDYVNQHDEWIKTLDTTFLRYR
jgi:hypothetical protein